MKDLLITTVEELGYPVFQQGSLGEDEPYPDSFFTFWNNYADGSAFYDNDEHSYIWDFDLNFYSNDPDLVNTKLIEAKEKLKSVGFLITGKGHEVASDEATHTGRGISVYIIEN